MNKLTGISLLVVGLSVRAWSAMGVAEVTGTAPHSPISGTVKFEDTTGGLKVSASLINVPPGQHGFHIHEFGSCGESGKSAGGHYNPMSSPHGQVLKDGMSHAHAGDLGNITAGADGKATLEALIPGVTLSGSSYTVGGRAVILHKKVDDFSQPVGNAGSRIGCGPIVIVGAPATAAPPPSK